MNAPTISLCCALLASCSTPLPPPPPPQPAPPAPPVAIVESAPEPAKPTAVTATVAKAYQKAAQKEIPVVIAANATPEKVRSVHTADNDARRALSKLESQGHHPTKEVLDAARAAVKQLSDVLNSTSE
jgi:hypothetical protein